MSKNKRAKPDVRKDEILRAGVTLAVTKGYSNLTRDDIATFIGIVPGTIQYHFGTVKKLRSEIMRHAVKTGNAAVVAQGLANMDPQAKKADEELQKAARAAL